jgi:hypothetical protein
MDFSLEWLHPSRLGQAYVAAGEKQRGNGFSNSQTRGHQDDVRWREAP